MVGISSSIFFLFIFWRDCVTLLAADVSPLVAKCEDPKMAEDPGVSQVVKQLDKACKEAGFFYVVIFQFPVHVL